jgi:hypothetical protein
MGTRKQNRKSNRNKKQKGGCGCDGGFKMNGGNSFETPSFNGNTLNTQYYNSFNGSTGTGGDPLVASNQIGSRYEAGANTTPLLMGGRRKTKGSRKTKGIKRRTVSKKTKNCKRKTGKMRGGNLSVSGFFTNLSGQSSNPYTTTYQPISEFKTNLARPPLA